MTRHEKRVQPDGQNLISVLHTLYTGDREFKKEINAAMNAAFGHDFEELVFAPASDQRIQLRVRWKSLNREQSAADLSDGTLRFLFLLTVLSSPGYMRRSLPLMNRKRVCTRQCFRLSQNMQPMPRGEPKLFSQPIPRRFSTPSQRRRRRQL